MIDDEDEQLNDEVVEEIKKRRNDDRELIPHEEVVKQVSDDKRSEASAALEPAASEYYCTACGFSTIHRPEVISSHIDVHRERGDDRHEGAVIGERPLVRLEDVQVLLNEIETRVYHAGLREHEEVQKKLNDVLNLLDQFTQKEEDSGGR